MQILLYLLLAFAVVILVGHGFWIVIAKIFHVLSGAPAVNRSGPSRHECRHCGFLTDPRRNRCFNCGQSRKTADQLADLRITLHQLQSFQRDGLLDEAAFERLSGHIEETRLKLLGKGSEGMAGAPSRARPHIASSQALSEEPEVMEALPVDEPAPVSARIRTPAIKMPQKPLHAPPKEPKPPKPPRRTLAEWMAAFMEERNILWGELIGGLLMVGCSIALVISLRTTLEAKLDYFPFIILAGLTLALFGAGLYTLHHWKLTSTSRGLLVIATLLVPLNCLALAGLSKGAEGGWQEIATKIIAMTVFFWMVHKIAKTLLPSDGSPSSFPRHLLSLFRHPSNVFSDALLVPLAVVLGSASQLPVRRLLDPAVAGGAFMFLGSWAVGLYGAGVGGALAWRARRKVLPDAEAGILLGILGVATFAVILSLGFLGYWIGSKGEEGALAAALQQMALLIMQLGAPVLAVGLFVRHRTGAAQAGSSSSHLLMAGTVVALAGMLVMLAGIFLAWPNPNTLIIVSLFNFVVLTIAAFASRLPVGHAVALTCLAVGYLTAYHLAAGNLGNAAPSEAARRLVEAACGGTSGVALAALFAVIVAAAEGLRFTNRLGDASFYRMGAWTIALFSLVFVGLEPLKGMLIGPEASKDVFRQATVVYGIYVVAALTFSKRWNWTWLDHAGAVLILFTTLLGMKWRQNGEYPFWGTALATEALLFSVLEAGWWVETILAAGLVLATAIVGGNAGITSWHTINSMLLAASAFVQARRWRAPALTWLSSALVLVGIGYCLSVRLPDLGLEIPAPILTTLLLHATIVQLGSFAVRLLRSEDISIFALPLGQSVLVTMTAAFPFLVINVPQNQLAMHASYSVWLAVLWLGNALIERRPRLFAVFQGTVTVAAVFAVAHFLVSREWVAGNYPRGLLDPRSLQGFGLALTGLSLLWGSSRLALRWNAASPLSPVLGGEGPGVRGTEQSQALSPSPQPLSPEYGGEGLEDPLPAVEEKPANSPATVGAAARHLFDALEPGLDRIQLYILVAVQALLIVWGIIPGIIREMTPATVALDQFSDWSRAANAVFGIGGWLWLASLAAVFFLWLWESRTALNQTGLLVGLLCLAILPALLYAGPFSHEQAAASALRWGLAFCFVVVCGFFMLLRQVANARASLHWRAPLTETTSLLRAILVSATALPVVALTVWMALEVFAGEAPRGADPSSFFARIGSTASHIVPLAFVLIGLTGHALRERSAGYAFASGLVANLITMGGYALGVVQSGNSLGWTEYVCLMQLGTVTSAAWALGWLAVVNYASPMTVPTAIRPRLDDSWPLLQVQAAFGIAGMAVVTLLPLVQTILFPARMPTEIVVQAGRPLGWLALVASTLAALVYLRRITSVYQGYLWGPLALPMGVVLASSLAHRDNGNWLTFHTLVTVWILGSWTLLIAGQSLAGSISLLRVRITPWTEILGGLAALTALVGEQTDPLRPWAPSLALLAVSLLVGSLALLKRRQIEVIVSALLLNVAGLLIWRVNGPQGLYSFTATVALGLAVASMVWTGLEWLQRKLHALEPEDNSDALGFARLFRHWAAVAAVILIAGIALGNLLIPWSDPATFARSALIWSAGIAATTAVSWCCWDYRVKFPLPSLYALGLSGLVLGLQALGLHGPEFQRAMLLGFSLFVFVAAAIAAGAPRLGLWRQALRLPDPSPVQPPYWFAAIETVAAFVPLVLSVVVTWSEDTIGERLFGPLAVSLISASEVLLVIRAAEPWRKQLGYATLALGVLLATEVGWALSDPSQTAQALHRWVAVLIGLAVTTVVYGFVLPRLVARENQWRGLSRQAAPILGLIACANLLPVILLEAMSFNREMLRSALGTWEVGAVFLALMGLIVAGIAFAVAPWADPFRLSEKRRRYYVYASELLLVFLFLHLRLNIPELFRLFSGKYWTFAVMVIAFVGVGLSEFFSRRKLDVLAEPLRRTGVFLPLLPLLAFWLKPPEALYAHLVHLIPGSRPFLDYLEGHALHFSYSYAALWFLFGLLYAVLAVMQRSFRYGLFAALAANIGLWIIWETHGIAILAHPQLWLIPLALIILVSEIINREHLSNELSTGLRYLGLGLLYVSSTADMFITGLGESVFLPLVLAVLSVMGVLAGILFRVRSYLYLGVGFLVLVIFSMIWHAAVDMQQAWVWWVSGIILGAAILALFALFEKRRLHLARVLEDFRSWR
ncbi:MAG: hypothetical protein ACJ8FY_09690 [Gemmataceae bacterium]